MGFSESGEGQIDANGLCICCKMRQSDAMRISVDIDDSILEELVRITGERKKSPAVAKAVKEFLFRRKAREFGDMLFNGEFHYDVLNDEIEAQQDTAAAVVEGTGKSRKDVSYREDTKRKRK
jgi:Arc/MetJ family transcription regulator